MTNHRSCVWTVRRCPSEGAMADPANSPGRVVVRFDLSKACPPPPPCGGNDCMCSCCTNDECLDPLEGLFASGDGGACSPAECAHRFFECPDPTSLSAADNNTATVLDVTPCVYPSPPPPCGSADCTCSCCQGDGCPALTVAELPNQSFRAGLEEACRHGQRALARNSPHTKGHSPVPETHPLAATRAAPKGRWAAPRSKRSTSSAA